jgi:endonuclease III
MPDRATVLAVCRTLGAAYPDERLDNPSDPVDDLIYIVISNKTAPMIAARTYEALKNRFSSWSELLDAPIEVVRRVLRPAGLAGIKARQLRAALRQVRQDFGHVSLATLRGWSEREQLAYLTSLVGVSDKVARCVMMYTLDARVLPVDAHVHRLAQRLGWTRRKRADQCHDELELLVPPARRFSFHVGAILHGRAVCRPRDPRCAECSLRSFCPTASSKPA